MPDKNEYGEKIELLNKLIDLQMQTIQKQQKLISIQEKTINDLIDKNANLHMENNV